MPEINQDDPFEPFTARGGDIEMPNTAAVNELLQGFSMISSPQPTHSSRGRTNESPIFVCEASCFV